MIVDIKVPEVGESITEGVLVDWLKRSGDVIAVDDNIFELETDKISMTVTAEHAGRLEVLVAAGSAVDVGQVVARVDTEAQAKPAEPAEAPQPAPQSAPPVAAPEPALTEPAGMPQAQAKIADRDTSGLSPAVRRLVEAHNLVPGQIPTSGPRGRLTKEDVLAHLAVDIPAVERSAPKPVPTARPVVVAEPPAASPPAARQTRRPMTPLRQRVAERLVQSQQSAAILTTFNEADMSGVMALRSRFKAVFKDRYEVGLGFMSFFVKAVVDALQAVPALNAQIQGAEIVENHYYDIGIAVGSPRGLVVPVIRDADKLGFAQVERAIGGLAQRARTGGLTLADLSGGVFTVSNGGIYGSMLSTPILNPPQSGILGMHAIKKRAVVVTDERGDDQIVVRPMMYLALSYDHRLVDGEQAVTFLKRVVDCIEHPERILLEV